MFALPEIIRLSSISFVVWSFTLTIWESLCVNVIIKNFFKMQFLSKGYLIMLKNILLLRWAVFASLLKINWLYMHRSISGLSVIFYCSVCLSWRHYHIVCYCGGSIRHIALEEEMATRSSVLAWRIPWTEEPGRSRPWGHRELDTTEWPRTIRHTEVT